MNAWAGFLAGDEERMSDTGEAEPKAKPPAAACGNCVYGRVAPGRLGDGALSCCRRSPGLLSEDHRVPVQVAKPLAAWHWPLVEAGWWCGEYAAGLTPGGQLPEGWGLRR